MSLPGTALPLPMPSLCHYVYLYLYFTILQTLSPTKYNLQAYDLCLMTYDIRPKDMRLWLRPWPVRLENDEREYQAWPLPGSGP